MIFSYKIIANNKTLFSYIWKKIDKVEVVIGLNTNNMVDIMPKSSKKQIDIDEKRIITELQKNSKESIDVIAKKYGFSRQKVWRMIKKLEENKTIWGYSAITDNEKLDIRRYVMLIKKGSTPANEAIGKIIDLTLHKKGLEIGVEVECSSYIHGEYDWIIIFTAKDIRNVKRFNEILNKEYQGIISDVQVMEDIFSVKKCGIVNPNIKGLKEFVSTDIQNNDKV